MDPQLQELSREISQAVTAAVTESVTTAVTESVTAAVTKSVTAAVTKSVTESVTAAVTESVEKRLESHSQDIKDQINKLENRVEERLQIHYEGVRDQVKRGAEGYGATLESIDRRLDRLEHEWNRNFQMHSQVLKSHADRIDAIEKLR
jgi:iron uptake system EfeUOB component EfeO/EfeM